MSTWGALLLDLAKNIATLVGYLTNRRRDKRARIATYFDQIASTLMEAAAEFERENRPWDKYREIGVYLENFFKVVGGNFPNSETTFQLWAELADALHRDRALLGGENGGGKVCHGSGGIVPLPAE